MEEKEKKINLLQLVSTVVLILSGTAGFLAGANAIWNSTSQPKFTVENHLALPVMVYINDNPAYTKRIASNSQATFELIGNSEFPATMKWEMLRVQNPAGDFLGESLSGSFPKVDKNSTISITNILNGELYFFPLLRNNTNQPCDIKVNDGLLGQVDVGMLNPHEYNIAPGYYRWSANSNLTLLCPNQVYLWGQRNGKQGGVFSPNSESGVLKLGIP